MHPFTTTSTAAPSQPSAFYVENMRTGTSRFWRRRRTSILLSLLCFIITFQESTSFTLEMNYKPPVKSSVKKLYDQRRVFSSSSSSSTTSSTNSGKGGISRPRSSIQKSAHAAAFTPPPTTASFEQRMRNLISTPRRPEPRTKDAATRSKGLSIPSNVVTVDNLREYKAVVGDESSRIVAVRFHATYCRACMAVAPHFYKLAKANPHVVFVDVPVTESNAALHQGLGVPSLPYGHIYHPQGGLMEEMNLTRKDIPEFREKLHAYTDGHCALPEAAAAADDGNYVIE